MSPGIQLRLAVMLHHIKLVFISGIKILNILGILVEDTARNFRRSGETGRHIGKGNNNFILSQRCRGQKGHGASHGKAAHHDAALQNISAVWILFLI